MRLNKRWKSLHRRCAFISTFYRSVRAREREEKREGERGGAGGRICDFFFFFFFNVDPIEVRRSDGERLRSACRKERVSRLFSASALCVCVSVSLALCLCPTRSHRSQSPLSLSVKDPPARPPATAGQKTRCPPARRTLSPQTSRRGTCSSTGHRAPSSATTT